MIQVSRIAKSVVNARIGLIHCGIIHVIQLKTTRTKIQCAGAGAA